MINFDQEACGDNSVYTFMMMDIGLIKECELDDVIFTSNEPIVTIPSEFISNVMRYNDNEIQMKKMIENTSNLNQLMAPVSHLHLPFSESFNDALKSTNTTLYPPIGNSLESCTKYFFNTRKSTLKQLKYEYDVESICKMDWIHIMNSDYCQKDDDVKSIEKNVGIIEEENSIVFKNNDGGGDHNNSICSGMTMGMNEFSENVSAEDMRQSMVHQNLESVIRFIDVYRGGFRQKNVNLTSFEKACKKLFMENMTCESIISPTNIEDLTNGGKLYVSGSINKRLFYKCIDTIRLDMIDIFRFYQFMSVQYQWAYVNLNIPMNSLKQNKFPIIHGVFILKPHVTVSNMTMGLCKILGMSILYYNDITDTLLSVHRKKDDEKMSFNGCEMSLCSTFSRPIYMNGNSGNSPDIEKSSLMSYQSISQYSKSNLVNQIKFIMKRMKMNVNGNIGDLNLIYGLRKLKTKKYLLDEYSKYEMSPSYRLKKYYEACHQWNENIMVIYENHFVEHMEYYLNRMDDLSLVDMKDIGSFMNNEEFKSITIKHLPNQLRQTFDNLSLNVIFPTVSNVGLINGIISLVLNGHCKAEHIEELRYYIYSITFESLKWKIF